MALEIHNCSRQGELIQDRAQFLQVLRLCSFSLLGDFSSFYGFLGTRAHAVEVHRIYDKLCTNVNNKLDELVKRPRTILVKSRDQFTGETGSLFSLATAHVSDRR
jgi:hypothetical protein